MQGRPVMLTFQIPVLLPSPSLAISARTALPPIPVHPASTSIHCCLHPLVLPPCTARTLSPTTVPPTPLPAEGPGLPAAVAEGLRGSLREKHLAVLSGATQVRLNLHGGQGWGRETEGPWCPSDAPPRRPEEAGAEVPLLPRDSLHVLAEQLDKGDLEQALLLLKLFIILCR